MLLYFTVYKGLHTEYFTTWRKRFFMPFLKLETHIIIFYTTTTTPQGSNAIFAYTPGAFWTIQHLTDTFAFKDHWSHDLHDLAVRRLISITIIILDELGNRTSVEDRGPRIKRMPRHGKVKFVFKIAWSKQ